MSDRCAYLNSLGIEELRYKGDNGTDLTVGLIPEGTFLGGQEITAGGRAFDPNIPTEECYTSPSAARPSFRRNWLDYLAKMHYSIFKNAILSANTERGFMFYVEKVYRLPLKE